MTREEAEQLLPIIKAFSEGKEIEGIYPIGKEIRTIEYVEKECKKLAEQLKIYDDNKSKGCEE